MNIGQPVVPLILMVAVCADAVSNDSVAGRCPLTDHGAMERRPFSFRQLSDADAEQILRMCATLQLVNQLNSGH